MNDEVYPKVLVLGDGLLGTEIVKQSGWEYVSWDKDGFDVTTEFQEMCIHINEDIDPDVIINCIGNTDTYSKEQEKHWKINYEFVANLADFCDNHDIKLVHVSTDYIYANCEGGLVKETDVPIHQNTWYAYTKLLSDAYVQLWCEDYLLVRCSFKPRPFPYKKAFDNVWGNFDYVDVIAGQIIDLVNEDRSGVWNIGTELKSVYDLAIQTVPDVEICGSDKLPTVSMDLFKFNNRKLL